MTPKFKVQFIRSCVQCGDVLSLKCKSCVKHPKRKPRVIEYHDWPEILEAGPCGCCIKIACQSPGCSKAMWRYTGHVKGGKSLTKRFFCSKPCFHRGNTLERVQVSCSYCTKPTTRKISSSPTWRHSFCNLTCYILFRRKAEYELRVKRHAAKAGTDGHALLQCNGRCRGAITEHVETRVRMAKCLVCAAIRPVSAVPGALR